MSFRRLLVPTLCLLVSLPGCSLFSALGGGSGDGGSSRSEVKAFQDAWNEKLARFDSTPAGDFERLNELYSLTLLYAKNINVSDEDKERLGFAERTTELQSRLDAELAYHQAAYDNWQGEVPTDHFARPSNSLRVLHGIQAAFLTVRREPLDAVSPHFIAMLTIDRQFDRTDEIQDPDLVVLATFQEFFGRQALHQQCRQALDVLPETVEDIQWQMLMLTCQWENVTAWQFDLSQWATAEEFESFNARFGELLDRRTQAVREAEEGERERESERKAGEMREVAAEQAAGGGGGGSGGGGGPVSVTIRNTCSSTVQVFYGDDPKFGSGRKSSLSGNSSQGSQMQVGDTIWIIDGSSNGIASATVSDSTREITVSSSCTSISSH